MEGMFDYCFVGKGHNDSRLDLSHWNVQKVQKMDLMFHNARFLRHLNTTGWQTTSLTDISNMFGAYIDPPIDMFDDPADWGYVSKLETIEGIGDWDVSHVTNMYSMFEYCIALTDQVAAGLANWRMPNLQNMNRAFRNTRKLTRLDLHNWAPHNLQSLRYAFAGSNATYVNLSGWHLPTSHDESSRGIFDHLGLGQPVLIVMKGITVDPVGSERYFNLKDLNASTVPTDRPNSDLPVGPLVMIPSDTNGNLAVRRNGEAITDSNNHWQENKIRFMPQKPATNNDLKNWFIDHCDDSDPDHEINNLAFAFANEDEAQTYLLNQLSDYLNSHHLTNQLSCYVGHSTYYDWYSTFDWDTMQDILVGKAKKYDPGWFGEGLNNPGPGTGDDYEHIYTSQTQDEKTTDPLTMNAANVRAALQNDQHTWADNFLPMLFSGIYFAEPIPAVTVTVQYKDVDTGQIVKTDPAISGQPGDRITLTFNIPAGYHEVAPEPSTSYTFTNTDGVVTVLVQRDTTPTPSQPNPNPNPEPNPNPNPDKPDQPDIPDEPGPNKPDARKPERGKTTPNKVPTGKTASRTNVQKPAVVAEKTLPQTSNSKFAALLGTILSLSALTVLGFTSKKT